MNFNNTGKGELAPFYSQSSPYVMANTVGRLSISPKYNMSFIGLFQLKNLKLHNMILTN